jgi:hypothetical protein
MWRLYARLVALTTISLIFIVIPTAILAQECRQPGGAHEQGLVLLGQYPFPVITVNSPGAEGNKHEFESGSVV